VGMRLAGRRFVRAARPCGLACLAGRRFRRDVEPLGDYPAGDGDPRRTFLGAHVLPADTRDVDHSSITGSTERMLRF
jgi:hypothetical protein